MRRERDGEQCEERDEGSHVKKRGRVKLEFGWRRRIRRHSGEAEIFGVQIKKRNGSKI